MALKIVLSVESPGGYFSHEGGLLKVSLQVSSCTTKETTVGPVVGNDLCFLNHLIVYSDY